MGKRVRLPMAPVQQYIVIHPDEFPDPCRVVRPSATQPRRGRKPRWRVTRPIWLVRRKGVAIPHRLPLDPPRICWLIPCPGTRKRSQLPFTPGQSGAGSLDEQDGLNDYPKIDAP